MNTEITVCFILYLEYPPGTQAVNTTISLSVQVHPSFLITLETIVEGLSKVVTLVPTLP